MQHCTGEGSTPCDPRNPTRLRRPTCTWPTLSAEPQGPAPRTAETLSFADALALIGVSRNTLYRLAGEGRIPGAQRIGRAWRFHRSTLLDFLAHPARPRGRR